MSFEDDLRARLRDLADAEAPWPDPAAAACAEASRTGQASITDEDQPAELADPASDSAPVSVGGSGSAGPLPPSAAEPIAPDELAPRRRSLRYLPGAVAAAIVLAAIVAGISYVAIDNSGGEAGSSSGGAAVNAPASGGHGRPGDGTAATSGFAQNALPTCGIAPGTSTGPLAAIAPVGPPGPPLGDAGGVNADGTAMSDADTSAPLAFTASGPTMQARPPIVYVVRDGAIIGQPDRTDASPQVITDIPVVPGGPTYPAARWQVPACDGTALPTGTYQLIVVYPYTVAGDNTRYQLVSPPANWDFP